MTNDFFTPADQTNYQEKFTAIRDALRALRPQDTIEVEEMGGGMVCLIITTPLGAIYVAGDAIDVWAADFYPTEQHFADGITLDAGAVQTTLDAREADPVRVAAALHEAIAQHPAGVARCRGCHRDFERPEGRVRRVRLNGAGLCTACVQAAAEIAADAKGGRR